MYGLRVTLVLEVFLVSSRLWFSHLMQRKIKIQNPLGLGYLRVDFLHIIGIL